MSKEKIQLSSMYGFFNNNNLNPNKKYNFVVGKRGGGIEHFYNQLHKREQMKNERK